MKLRLEDRNRARQLRGLGYSYQEIRATIPKISKSTLSTWVRDIELTQEQRQQLHEKMRLAGHAGRQKGARANHAARVQRRLAAESAAKQRFVELAPDPVFLAGVALYWAEGSKTQEMFQFMNSDPQMIQFMLRWLTRYAGVKREQITARVYAHAVYQDQNPDQYWQTVTQLELSQFRRTVYKPTTHTQRKNLRYMGCCRIEVLERVFFWTVMTWKKQLASI